MAAKTYPRFPLRVLRPRDQILGGTSNYYEVSEAAGIKAGFPLQASGGQVVVAGIGSPIVAFALQDAVDKNGVALADGELIETFLANDPEHIFLEGNLLNGLAGAQVDYVLQLDDLFDEITLTFDANYLGAGQPGFYFNVAAPGGGIGGDTGQGRVVSFINTRVPSNEESSVAVPGDTNAVVRVQMSQTDFLLPTTAFVGP